MKTAGCNKRPVGHSFGNKGSLLSDASDGCNMNNMTSFIVNLPEDDERRRNVKKLASGFGTAPVVPQGVKGIDFVSILSKDRNGVAIHLNTCGRERLGQITIVMNVRDELTAPGTLGCSLSHHACLQLARGLPVRIGVGR